MSKEEDLEQLDRIRALAGATPNRVQNFGRYLSEQFAENLADIDPADRARVLLHVGLVVSQVNKAQEDKGLRVLSDSLLVAAVNQGESRT